MIPTKLNSSVYYYPGIKVANYSEQDIINDVCSYFKVSPEMIKKRNKEGNIVMCRQVCAYMIKSRFPSKLLKEIGGFIGRDHATVIHSVKTVENDMATSKLFKDLIVDINEIIDNHLLKNSGL